MTIHQYSDKVSIMKTKEQKSPVTKITLTRAEGPNPLPPRVVICTTPCFDTTGSDSPVGSLFCKAQIVFNKWSHTAPKEEDGGYDKCDFEVEWAEGATYRGRYDLVSSGRDDSGDTLQDHIINSLTYHSTHGNPEAQKEAQDMLDTLELI